MASSENNECNERKSVLNLTKHFESEAKESAKDKPNRGTKMDTTTECTNSPIAAMASSESGESEKRKSVSNLETPPKAAAIETTKSKQSRKPPPKPRRHNILSMFTFKKTPTKTKPPPNTKSLPRKLTDTEHKSVDMVHKSDDLNSKIQPMENKNAVAGIEQIQETANIDTNGQTLEKKKDSTKSDIKQHQEQSTRLEPETRKSLNNYITPEAHKIQEESSETSPTQNECKNIKPKTQSDTNTNIEQDVDNNTQNVLGEDANINQLQEDHSVSDNVKNPHLCQNVENTKIQQLEEQLSSKNTELQLILAEKNDMELIQKHLETECSDLCAIIEVICEDNGIQLSPVEMARNTMVLYLTQENATINAQKQQLEDENIDKNNLIEDLFHETENQNNEIHQLRQENSRIEQLQQEKNNKDSEIRNLQQEINSKNNEIQKLQQDKNNEIQNLQRENEHKNNEIQQLRQENSEKNNRIEHLEKENKIKDNEILQVRNKNQKHIQEIQEKNIAIKRHEQDLESKNNEILRLQQVIENSNKLAEKGSVVVSDEELGRGGYGAVYKGDFYGTKVAVKEYYEVILSNYNSKVLKREINIASQCRHPNLLQFICASENDKNHLLIVTELLDMTLRKLIEQHAEAQSLFSSQDVKSISLDVARGLNYLHSKKPDPIIHRDISSANVLLSIANGVVARAKISDYGSAKFMELCNTKNPGAVIYAAPEAGSSQQDPKLDVFSYGILVCEMAICDMPDPKNRRDQINQISHIGIKELVNNCTRDESKERPNMHNVITTWENMKME